MEGDRKVDWKFFYHFQLFLKLITVGKIPLTQHNLLTISREYQFCILQIKDRYGEISFFLLPIKMIGTQVGDDDWDMVL